MKYRNRFMVVAVIASLFAASSHAQQSVSVAPTDKPEAANVRPALQIPGTKEYPEGLKGANAKWMVPPKPIPLDWNTEDDGDEPTWEYAWEVTHIKFDHQEGYIQDGMNIRWTYRHDLDHQGDGKGDGEYIVKEERNEPALYRADEENITVKVRIQVKDANGDPPGQASQAQVRATAGGTGSFMSLEQRMVQFGANGISIGDDGTEYVEFSTLGAVPGQYGEYTVRYKFHLSQPKINILGDMGPPREVEFDELSRIDVYSVFWLPHKPWNHGDTSTMKARSQPWVSALAFLCYPCGCANLSSVETIAGNTAKHLHWGHAGTSGHGMVYDHGWGATGFGTSVRHLSNHNLTQYMTKWKNGAIADKVNCMDQASAVHALMQLASSGDTKALYMRGDSGNGRDRFGYMEASTFVGGSYSNHPFHLNPDYVLVEIAGNDDLISQTDANGRFLRSAFDFHAAVRMVISGNMVDAMFGPVVPAMGLNIASYLGIYRDTTTQDEVFIGGKHIFAPGDEVEIDLVIR